MSDLIELIDTHLAALPKERKTITVDEHRDVLLDIRNAATEATRQTAEERYVLHLALTEWATDEEESADDRQDDDPAGAAALREHAAIARRFAEALPPSPTTLAPASS